MSLIIASSRIWTIMSIICLPKEDMNLVQGQIVNSRVVEMTITEVIATMKSSNAMQPSQARHAPLSARERGGFNCQGEGMPARLHVDLAAIKRVRWAGASEAQVT